MWSSHMMISTLNVLITIAADAHFDIFFFHLGRSHMKCQVSFSTIWLSTLTLSTLGKFSADDILQYFSYFFFPENRL